MTPCDRHGKVTVLLVDDHAVVREGYKRLLEGDGDISVVGEAESAEKALSQFSRLHPDVVVMDIALPGVSGMEALRRMRQRRPASNILMFSMYEEAVYADRSMQAGASGYVTKASAPDVLIEAVHAVAAGKKFFSRTSHTSWRFVTIIRQKLGADTAVQLARTGEKLLRDPRYAARMAE